MRMGSPSRWPILEFPLLTIHAFEQIQKELASVGAKVKETAARATLESLSLYLQALVSRCAVCGEDLEPGESATLTCLPCQVAVRFARTQLLQQMQRDLEAD